MGISEANIKNSLKEIENHESADQFLHTFLVDTTEFPAHPTTLDRISLGGYGGNLDEYQL